MADDRRLEVKVGVLIAAALAGIAGLLYLVGGVASGGRVLNVDLSHSGNIPKGAPVRMAGVKVGKVADVVLMPERVDEEGRLLAVRMKLEIDEDVFGKLHQGTQVEFATQGPLGEAYIQLAQGDVNGPTLKENDVLRAYPPRLELLIPRLVELLETVQSLAGEVDQGQVRTLLGELRAVAMGARRFLDEQGPVIGDMVQRLSNASVSLEKMAERGNQMLGRNGDLSRTLRDLAEVSSSLKRELPGMEAQARTALDNFASLSSSLTPEDMARLKTTLAEAEAASRKLDALLAKADSLVSDADRMLAGVEQGKGSLGALVKDDALYEDLRALITELKAHPWKLLWKKK